MKTKLLIQTCWYPYNGAGIFRWLNFSKYIDFDILTSKVAPHGFVDYKLPKPSMGKEFLHGSFKKSSWTSVWLIFIGLFKRNYDVYIFKSPNEILMFGAWFYQLIGRKVVLDSADMIDRTKQPHRWLIPVFTWFYNRIKHKIVCWKFMQMDDEEVIFHGHQELVRDNDALETPIYYNTTAKRKNYEEFTRDLTMGILPDYQAKPDDCGVSSIHNIKHLGYEVNNPNLHPEVYSAEYFSWRKQSEKMMSFLEKV